MSRKPEILVFAGPNGSGKTTITEMANTVGVYVNADMIKAANQCGDLEAARIAETMRQRLVAEKADFTFETVLSTDRNLQLLMHAKENGYFIRCIYVLTANPDINISRVRVRFSAGGHNVPEDKIIGRYHRALAILPRLIPITDICHIYDNSDIPFRIFKKRKTAYFYWENRFWRHEQISQLTGIAF